MNRSIKPIRVEGNIAYVPLTRGYEAIIDAKDVPVVEGRNWHAFIQRRKDGSIMSVYARSNQGREQIYIHREVVPARGSGLDVDHVDGNGLNNQKKNLRLVTDSQNQMNRRININNSSGYKGVTWHKGKRAWVAQISKDGKQTSLGRFATPEDAAAAYARASAEMHGEHGRLR